MTKLHLIAQFLSAFVHVKCAKIVNRLECVKPTDRAPSCGKKGCTYLQVGFHKVNARLQLLMKRTPKEKTYAVNTCYKDYSH